MEEWDDGYTADRLRAERLELHTPVPASTLMAIVNSAKFPRLVSLDTWCHDGAPSFLKKLAKSPAAARFRELDLKVHLTPAAARELADSPHLGGRPGCGTGLPAERRRGIARRRRGQDPGRRRGGPSARATRGRVARRSRAPRPRPPGNRRPSLPLRSPWSSPPPPLEGQ